MSDGEIEIRKDFISRIFTVNVVKFYTVGIAGLKISSSPALHNRSSSNLNLLDITIGCINNHVGRKLYK